MQYKSMIIFFSVFNGPLLFANCFEKEAKKLKIDSRVLMAIAKQESNFNPSALNENKNGTVDKGMMQINSYWEDKLEMIGIKKESLYDPCISLKASAWILNQNFKIYGKSWQAIGAYNVGTRKGKKFQKMRENYAQNIFSNYVYFRMRPNEEKRITQNLFFKNGKGR